MKTTLIFDLPNEQEEFSAAINGLAAHCALREIDNLFRTKLKYEEDAHTEKELELLQQLRDEINRIIEYHNLDVL